MQFVDSKPKTATVAFTLKMVKVMTSETSEIRLFLKASVKAHQHQTIMKGPCFVLTLEYGDNDNRNVSCILLLHCAVSQEHDLR